MIACLRFPVIYPLVSLLSSSRYVVEGDSMKPGLSSGQYLLVNRLAYRFRLPSRGDVALIREPVQPSFHYIKRVVALPGEHVLMDGAKVFIDGRLLDEPYLDQPLQRSSGSPSQWLLDTGEFFVLGDFRQDSRDSRSFGPVTLSDIVGRAWFCYWPPKRWGRVD